MSRRSYDSQSHSKRLSKHRVSDEELFEYVLRVAILSHITSPKPLESPQVPHDQALQKEREREREHSSRLSALSNFSLGDMLDSIRDGSKSVKFPEKLLKVLEQKLQDIAMGKDPAYSDQLVRRTMAKFYGQFMVDSFKRQMKDNRKIEDLILMFATHATSVLKKEPTLSSNDGWKLELNNQIAVFVKMLRECLRNVHHVSPELLGRLDTYTAKLAPATMLNKVGPGAFSDSGYESSSTSRDSTYGLGAVSGAGGIGGAGAGGQGTNMNVGDMQLVKTVGKLLKMTDRDIQGEVDKLVVSGEVTGKAAITDLKTCLKNISAGAPFPGRREDFESEVAWQNWKTIETTHLQQLMVAMIQTNPELAKSTSSDAYTNPGGRPTSVYDAGFSRQPSIGGSRRSTYENGLGLNDPYESDEDLPIGHHFTFIPPNPKKYYKRLVEYCLLADLEIMLSPEVDDNDEVSLGILSSPHLDLINECALRWRIGHPFRAICFLELVKNFYERNEVPMECVPEALQGVTKVLNDDLSIDFWMVSDIDYLLITYGGLINIFLSSLYHAMDVIPNLKPSEIKAYVEVLEHIQNSGVLERTTEIDLPARMNDIQEKVKQVVASWSEETIKKFQQQQTGVNRAIPLLLMTNEIEKMAKLLDKRFPEPLLGQLDITSLYVEISIDYVIKELQNSQKRLFESSMNGPTPDVPIQDIFELYNRVKTMLGMHSAFVQGAELQFDLGGFFEPYVRQWLINTDAKTEQWVDAAIAADTFEAEGAEGHSSSIVDLFDSLRSPINFLQDLQWDDEYQEARFCTHLSKSISNAVEQYRRSVESLFLTEMYPRPTDYLQPQKSSAWIEKARQLALTGEKKVEPFNFLPQSCVKLNNIEAARKLLDAMYQQMQADKLAEILKQAPPVPEKTEKGNTFLFSVKIVIAEGLVALDSSPSSKLDTFVTLSDESGRRVAKTRTIYESLDPRWEETFDISVEKPLWLMVSVRDRALVGKHDIVGRAYLCLDPRRFGDLLTHELWMDLDTQGRILVRVSMEGEKDDILFYFGRGFRSLKRAEGDMLRIFIDKMLPFIKQCLSRNVVKSLLKSRDQQGLDYNKALGNVTALYRSAVGAASSEPQIPLPSGEKPRTRPEELTDFEIEQGILPLFDYFDANLQTLNTYLSERAKEMVMTRVWKEILTVIEELLIPPLSDLPSDMKPLSDKEVDIVFKWLKFLRDYFYAGGEGPVPLELLQNQKYRDILSIRLYYDWHTDALMEECVRMMQQSLRQAPTIKKRAKSVYQQRNLGTIRERKKEKQQETEATSEQTIMRILRMRPRTQEFIAQQMQIMAAMQAEQEQRAKEVEERKAKRGAGGGSRSMNQIPPVPPLPPQKP